MESFANRLTEALRVRKMTAAELSRRIGVNEGTVSNYKKGLYVPKQRRLETISEALNVSISWLLGNDTQMDRPYSENVHRHLLPVLGSVPAGIPIEAIQDIVDYEEISDEMASGGEFMALRIRGDSMEPRIKEGDVVIIRRQEHVENGEIALVMINGNDATLKKFFANETGITLIGTNPAFIPLTFTREQVEQLPALIMIYAGLRLGEVCALTWSDVDLEARTITVNKSLNFRSRSVKSPKTAAGVRTVPIPQRLADFLAAAPRTSLLVCHHNGAPYTIGTWNHYWEQYTDLLGFKTTAHCLRHTYATILFEADVDVLTAKEFMGHSDIATTMRIYTHLRERQKAKSVSKLDAYLSPHKTDLAAE